MLARLDVPLRVPAFLADGGEMGSRMREHEWDASPLGAPSTWPPSLAALVGVMLGSPQPVFLVWGPGRTLLYNDLYAHLLGERHPSALGRDYLDVWHDLGARLAPLVDAARSGRPVHAVDIEHASPKRDGAGVERVSPSYVCIRDADGRVDGLYGTCIAATGRDPDGREAEVSLHDSEERQSFLLDLSDALRPLTTPAEIVEVASRRLGERVGASRVFYAEIGGSLMKVEREYVRGVGSIVGEHSLAAFGPDLLAAYRDGVVVAVEDVASDLRFNDEARAGLQSREVAAFVDIVLFRGEEWVGLLAVQNEVPRAWTPAEGNLIREVGERVKAAIERARAEVALRESERRLQHLNETLEQQISERTAERNLFATIVERTDIMVMAVDLGYTILAINKANADEFERIYGVRPKVGDNMLDLLADQPEHQAQVRAEWGRGLAGEEITFVADFGDAERARPSYEISFRTLRDAQGARAGCYQFVMDVTERLRGQAELAEAQEALRQSQKLEAVGQLTGGVAHDFNNLLTVIRSSVDFLRRPDLPEARKRRYLDAVSETVERAAKLTGQLLAFARRQALKPEVFDVGQRVGAIADMLDTLTGSRVRILTRVPDGTCLVRADVSQFETALVNMAVNARDAMDGEGTLSLRVTCGTALPPIRGHAGSRKPFVAVSLIDTGTGIALDRIGRIFEPFYTTKEVGKGTGLGLSQVFGFAKQSGGDVDVSSTPGEGTTFTLYLPEVPSEERPAGDRPRESGLAPLGGGQRILVVEDNIGVGQFATQILEDLGYQPTWAANAEEALDELGREGARFDLVFSDVVMPGMGGVALAQALQQRSPRVPVVLTSGYSHVLAQSDAHGFELLHKPYSAEQLSRVLHRVLGLRASPGPV
ncbi:PAS domain-containing protein [uncultured Methylobacterium sp.]|uniref:GAF domain-containing hybrid sensor histidine kinase/response regulator n=1 Tax=uncultured Methylobacterium sp. TaxID=157278 RepID=UPI002630F442|nr:PAS domain-containing protein [uncultured Methylobacterium sp.]